MGGKIRACLVILVASLSPPFPAKTHGNRTKLSQFKLNWPPLPGLWWIFWESSVSNFEEKMGIPQLVKSGNQHISPSFRVKISFKKKQNNHLSIQWTKIPRLGLSRLDSSIGKKWFDTSKGRISTWKAWVLSGSTWATFNISCAGCLRLEKKILMLMVQKSHKPVDMMNIHYLQGFIYIYIYIHISQLVLSDFCCEPIKPESLWMKGTLFCTLNITGKVPRIQVFPIWPSDLFRFYLRLASSVSKMLAIDRKNIHGGFFQLGMGFFQWVMGFSVGYGFFKLVMFRFPGFP